MTLRVLSTAWMPAVGGQSVEIQEGSHCCCLAYIPAMICNAELTSKQHTPLFLKYSCFLWAIAHVIQFTQLLHFCYVFSASVLMLSYGMHTEQWQPPHTFLISLALHHEVKENLIQTHLFLGRKRSKIYCTSSVDFTLRNYRFSWTAIISLW